MSIKEFWEDDPNYLWAYRSSYMEKLKVQREINNNNAWLSGMYVFEAVSIALYNCFGRKQTDQPKNFSSKPYDLNKTEEEYEKEKHEKMEENLKESLKRIKQNLK